MSSKTIFAFFLLYLFSFTFATLSLEAQDSQLASCCISKEGRCTGSMYCTACTNCTRCKYCNSGGSCGVCAGGSTHTNRRQSSHHSTKVTATNTSETQCSKDQIFELANETYSANYLKPMTVHINTLNLRCGPNYNYDILEQLVKHQELTYLAMVGYWVKVKVNKTNTIGFVHYKYVQF